MKDLKYITGVVAASILFAGCSGKNESSTASAPSPESPSVNATSGPVADTSETEVHPVASTPVIQPILTVLQEGHQEAAINAFLDADWNARPIFPAGMALGLTDAQMKGLPDTDRQLKTNEMMAQVGLVGQLVTAVSDAAQDAVSKGDVARARKCYLSLKQFGTALDNPANQPHVKHLGLVARNMAKLGLAKLGM